VAEVLRKLKGYLGKAAFLGSVPKNLVGNLSPPTRDPQ